MYYMVSKFLLLVCLLAGLTGCAAPIGKLFPIEEAQHFVSGKTQKSEVIERLGAPLKQETRTFKKDFAGKDMPSGVITQVLEYFYGERFSGNAAMENVFPEKQLIMYFVDDTLIGFTKASSFKIGSTDFDLNKISQLEKNKGTEQDVLRLLGPPGGNGVYPFSIAPNIRSAFYDVRLYNHPVGSNTRKNFTVHYSEDNIIKDFSVESKTEVNPARPAAPVPITIYVPAVKGR